MAGDSKKLVFEKTGRFYTLLFVGFSVLVVVMVGYFLELTHRQTARAMEVSSLNEAHILSARTDALLRHIESSAMHVADHFVAEMRGAKALRPLPDATRRALTSLTEKFPEIIATQVFDGDGALIFSSASGAPMFSVAEQAGLRKSAPTAGLEFTAVIALPESGKPAIIAYRAIVGENGESLGLVACAVDLTYLGRLLSELEVGESGMVSIRRSDDSRLVVRWPIVAAEINKTAEKTPPFLLVSQGQSDGVIRYVGKSDGVDRLFAFFKVPAFPFYVLVGRGIDEQFASWRMTAAISITLTAGAIAALWLMLWRLRRSERRVRDASLFLNSTQSIARVGGWKANPEKNTVYWTEEIYHLIERPLGGAAPSLEEGLTYYAPEYRASILANLERAWVEGSSFSMEVEVLAEGGRRFWAELRCVGRVNDGNDQFLTGTLQDISARKATEIELNQHRNHLEELVAEKTKALEISESNAKRILESSADGLFGMDNHGCFTFINPAACNMLGLRPDEVIGKPVHALIHHSRPDGKPYPASECPSHRAIVEGRGIRIDNEVYWHSDGHPVPVMYAAHPIVEGDSPRGAVISFVDVSHQRMAEEARQKALLAAEKLGRARSEFLANMSHEIRTPLNGVIGYAEIGYRNALDGEKARDAFSKIRQSGKMLLGVINDILDFSKIEAGKLHIEAIDTSLNAILETVMDIVAGRAREKQLKIQVLRSADLPDGISSDPIRIQQILVNLLTNAIKFTHDGSVVLTVEKEGGHILFRVSDTGIGMNEEQLSRLFTPFEQADGSTTRKFGGTGLGLAIVKRLVDLMAGEIAVRSSPGAGSTFEVRLPLVAASAAADKAGGAAESLAPQVAERPLRGIRVLVAEDNEINQEVLASNLEDFGASVTMVGNGREAVETIARDGSDAYDIVLMDIQMPEMNGHEATRVLLEMDPGLPIVGQTAHAFAEEIEACFTSGMVSYLGKPIDPDKLVETVLHFAKPYRSAGA